MGALMAAAIGPAAADSGKMGLMKQPVLHSKPATFVSRGRISMCQ